MNKVKKLFHQIYDKILIACGSLAVLLPFSPLNMSTPYRDSGVFLYFGWRILNGELPYRDIWDHKPPIIFYLNALGLAITSHSRWGVWLIEFVCLFIAFVIGFSILKKILGILPAVYCLFLSLITLSFVIQGGNLTEEYALPLQFLALWLICNEKNTPSFSFWRWFLIGISGTLAFFTKETTIGIWISIVLYLTLSRVKQKQTRKWFLEILSLLGGSIVVCCGILLPFAAQGALAQFWDAAFRYNFAYSSVSGDFIDRLQPLIAGIEPLTRAGLFQCAMLGYLLAVILFFHKKDVINKWIPLLIVGLFDLPIEIILFSISGRTYPHYYITILPVLFIFSGLTFRVFLSKVQSWNLPKVTSTVFQLSIVVILLWSSFNSCKVQASQYGVQKNGNVIRYIVSNTEPGDYVLFWGAESSINFLTKRQSPTRYVYQYPLYTPGYVNETMILDFLDDIIQNRPELIIDTQNSKTPIYDFPIQTKDIQKDVEFIKSHYRELQKLGNWVVFGYAEEMDTP